MRRERRGETSGEESSRSKSMKEEEAGGAVAEGGERGKGGKAEERVGEPEEERRNEATKRSRAGQSREEAG